MAHIGLISIAIFFSFFSLPRATSFATCPAFCGGIQVRFPFTIRQDTHCGFPRFDLSCTNQTKTTLTLSLPYPSGDFIVQGIDYKQQTIWINDPDYCLPKRFLQGFTSLSSSPFDSTYSRSFTFLNCSSSFDVSSVNGLRLVSCLSGLNHSVAAVPTKDYETSPIPSCVKISSVLVPVQWPPWDDLTGGVRLLWTDPDCSSCETRGGICVFRDYNSLAIGCSGLPSNTGLSKGAKYGITIGVVIPSFICLMGLVCHYYIKFRSYYDSATDLVVSTALPQAVILTGLDGPTIESYPKILLREGGKLPRPSDNVCPICLCEYQTNDTLRSIPECTHYFHANCVDEWLKINATCPLCRKTPEDSTLAIPSTTPS